ncbi:RHS repeat-associated core domain-containing protein [Streptomyces sp. NPDC059861]|uniref:RHS repeat-associated core domain-containing protein n=1 Tax=Streptomyces sp. NPDC059861 TaxID=3346974 RepID=UPI00364BD211
MAFDSDEYGRSRAEQESTRYGWLGNHQRSSETVSSLMLMGVRLYNPDTGRFLSVDPVYGGNENAYEYCGGDPVACIDTTGKLGVRWWKAWWSPKYFIRLDLNRSETRWIAFGTGSAAGSSAGPRTSSESRRSRSTRSPPCAGTSGTSPW